MILDSIKLTKNKTPLYIQLYGQLKSIILNKEIPYGYKLPTIREVVTACCVNSSTVVKAYEKLKKDNLIEKRVGSGSYVIFGSENYSTSIMDFTGRDSNIDIFPVSDIKEAISDALSTQGADAFTYERSQGYGALLDSLNTYLKVFNINCPPELIQVVSGGQQAIDIISKALIHFGDSVITESPTYKGALDSFKSRDARIIQIPISNGGINLKKLEARIKIECPSFLYIMPHYQKPTGICYSFETKKNLIKLSEKYNFYIVEDDLGSEIDLTNSNIVTLKSLDRFDRVIYIKSFTPLFMPGLRLGCIALPSSINRRLKKIKVTTDISTPGIIQRGFSNYLDNYNWNSYYKTLLTSYKKKIDIVSELLNKNFDGLIEFKIFNPSPIFWIRLLKGDSSRLEQICREKKVYIIPGYTIGPEYNDYFRLSVKGIPIENIPDGLNILKKSINKLYEEDDLLDFL